MSFVHGLRSSGTSVSSLTVAIEPSAAHWSFLQSPAVWTERAVPAATFMLPQTPAVQVRWTHSVSGPEQSAATLQAAQILLVPQTNVQSALTLHGLPGAHLPQ